MTDQPTFAPDDFSSPLSHFSSVYSENFNRVRSFSISPHFLSTFAASAIRIIGTHLIFILPLSSIFLLFIFHPSLYSFDHYSPSFPRITLPISPLLFSLLFFIRANFTQIPHWYFCSHHFCNEIPLIWLSSGCKMRLQITSFLDTWLCIPASTTSLYLMSASNHFYRHSISILSLIVFTLTPAFLSTLSRSLALEISEFHADENMI